MSDAVVRRPSFGRLVGNGLVATACAAAAAAVVQLWWDQPGAGNARTNGRSVVLIAALAIAAAGFLLRSLRALAVRHCRACATPIDSHEDAWHLPLDAQAGATAAVATGGRVTLETLASSAVLRAADHLVLEISRCRCSRVADLRLDRVGSGGDDRKRVARASGVAWHA